ncbi:hypothetical protein [Aeromonas sobria]|uniref:hypothetical protein n=1 Tax=Aeromonas sobria TaxID=646 RepID=UPI0011DF23D9|nr:hypothetical protein [Aeromonas sobria]
MEQAKRSYQIFVPRQPADIKTRLWVVGFVGPDIDRLMPHLRGMNYRMVKASNKRHAKRILQSDIKKMARLAYKVLGYPLTISACLAKDY